MKLDNRAYLVGGGDWGFNLSPGLDCNVYVVDCGSELAMIDVGLGYQTSHDEIIANIRAEGLDPKDIKHIFVTHAHADHAGGLAQMKQVMKDAKVYVSQHDAPFVRDGDADAIGLTGFQEGGFYPNDFVLEACPVDVEVQEGQELVVGDCKFGVIETPGHCNGHVCYTMKVDGLTYLFTGDALFHGGKIVIQNTPDCLVYESGASIRKMANLSVDVFLPGHLSFSLRNGQRHIDAAIQVLDNLGIPPSIF